MHNRPYIRPSDARSWLHCRRRVWYDNFPPENFEHPELDPFDNLIMQMGLKHEYAIKKELEKEYKFVEAASNNNTIDLMNKGIEAIYQGELVDEELGVIGKPDFLIKQPNGEYQAIDAKLSRNPDKKEIQIQLGVYQKLLGNSLPSKVILGDKSSEDIGPKADKEADKFLSDMRIILSNIAPPEASYGESKCSVCPYTIICKPKFLAKEELTLLYGIDARSVPHLKLQNIDTITALSKCEPQEIEDVPYLKGFKKKQKVILQARAYFSNMDYQISPVQLPNGTWVHFDIEANPLTDSGEEHVYLWGFLKPPYGRDNFEYVWTGHENDDEKGWLEFLKLMQKYKTDYPDLVLCHFSDYEVARIKRYAKRYCIKDHPIVDWLTGEKSPLFDIKKPVDESFVLPLSSYGLKAICKHEGLVNFQWSLDDSGSQWSVVKFIEYRNESNKVRKEQIKSEILTYNFDDVMATRKLEEWLRNKLKFPKIID